MSNKSQEDLTIGGNYMHPRRSLDDAIDTLCPICVEACSCDGRTELTIQPRKTYAPRKRPARTVGASASQTARKSRKIPPPPSQRSHPVKESCLATDAWSARCKRGTAEAEEHIRPRSIHANFPSKHTIPISEAQRADLDAQYALSEYYFSENESGEESAREEADLEEEERQRNAYEEEDLEALAQYYGYSSGSDVTLETLFIASSDDEQEGEGEENREENEERRQKGEKTKETAQKDQVRVKMQKEIDADTSDQEDEKERMSTLGDTEEEGWIDQEPQKSLLFRSTDEGNFVIASSTTTRHQSANHLSGREESLSEQLAKITPQILAAISVAAKNMRHSQGSQHSDGRNCRMYVAAEYETTASQSEGEESSEETTEMISIEDLMDTAKLAKILSTSPPPTSTNNSVGQFGGAITATTTGYACPRRRVPMGAFRRTRRGSLQHFQPPLLASALRHHSLADCTLVPALDSDELLAFAIDKDEWPESWVMMASEPTENESQMEGDKERRKRFRRGRRRSRSRSKSRRANTKRREKQVDEETRDEETEQDYEWEYDHDQPDLKEYRDFFDDSSLFTFTLPTII